MRLTEEEHYGATPRWVNACPAGSTKTWRFEQVAEPAARHDTHALLRGSPQRLGGPQFAPRRRQLRMLQPQFRGPLAGDGRAHLTAARLAEPVLGVFLDFVYARQPVGSWGTAPASYDEKILSEFAQARDLTLPDLQPQERAPWLEENGLHDAFREFQIDSWRGRVRALREQVDAINPDFQFVIYPSSFTLFVNEVVWTELPTERAPLLAAEHYTYGRGSPLKDIWEDWWRVSDEEGLALDVAYIGKMQRS